MGVSGVCVCGGVQMRYLLTAIFFSFNLHKKHTPSPSSIATKFGTHDIVNVEFGDQDYHRIKAKCLVS